VRDGGVSGLAVTGKAGPCSWRELVGHACPKPSFFQFGRTCQIALQKVGCDPRTGHLLRRRIVSDWREVSPAEAQQPHAGEPEEGRGRQVVPAHRQGFRARLQGHPARGQEGDTIWQRPPAQRPMLRATWQTVPAGNAEQSANRQGLPAPWHGPLAFWQEVRAPLRRPQADGVAVGDGLRTLARIRRSWTTSLEKLAEHPAVRVDPARRRLEHLAVELVHQLRLVLQLDLVRLLEVVRLDQGVQQAREARDGELGVPAEPPDLRLVARL